MRVIHAAGVLAAAAILTCPQAAAATGVVEGAFAPPGWTPSQLPLCAQPNVCTEVLPGLNLPGSIPAGADQIEQWLAAQPAPAAASSPDAPQPQAATTVVGHSLGAQDIYEYLRRHPDAPGTFIVLGNPERKYGGTIAQGQGSNLLPAQGLPANLSATVIDVARQYDGWADAPQDTSNGLAVLNSMMGGLLIHPFYNVDIYDPNNVTWQEGSVTYVLVPTATLPLLMPLQWFGIDTTALDAQLRPQIEAAYTRPIPVPDDPTAAQLTETALPVNSQDSSIADVTATAMVAPSRGSVLVAGEPTVASDLNVSVTQNSLESGITADRPHAQLTNPKKVRKPERVEGVQVVRQPHSTDATPKRAAEAPKKRDTPKAERKAERQAEKADKPKKHDR